MKPDKQAHSHKMSISAPTGQANEMVETFKVRRERPVV